MTKEEILGVKAGPELDLLITEKILGWKRSDSPAFWKCGAKFALMDRQGYKICPKCQVYGYSTEIERAWEVVEKMMAKGYNYTIRGNFEGNGKHWCGFDHQNWADSNPIFQSPLCNTLPMAICKAALIAVLEDENGQ